jgi:hypothetical protein
VLNQPGLAEKHFYGLKEAKENLVGIAIYDQLKSLPISNESLIQTCWKRREIENYFVDEASLMRYANSGLTNDLFGANEAERREKSMRQAIESVSSALKILKGFDPWSEQIKITDEFLDKVFEIYFENLKLPNQMRKTDYHMLIDFFDTEKLDKEISEKLDAIVDVAQKAQPEIDFN